MLLAIDAPTLTASFLVGWLFAVHTAPGLFAQQATHPGAGTGVVRPEPAVVNSRTFSIPFSVDATGTQPAKVQLFVGRPAAPSVGNAIQWELRDEALPDAKQFQFSSSSDGVYFFTTRTIDVENRAHSQGNILEVVIDTAGPEIDLALEVDDSGRVEVQYGFIDSTALRDIQYQFMTDTDRVWRLIENTPRNAKGRFSFVPTGAWDQVSVNASVTDAAGNHKSLHRIAQRPRVAFAPSARLASSPIERGAAGQTVPWMTAATHDNQRRLTITAVPPAASDAAPPVNTFFPAPAASSEFSENFGLNGPAQMPPSPMPFAGGSDPAAAANLNTGIGPAWNVLPPSTTQTIQPRPKTPAEAMRPLDTSAPWSLESANAPLTTKASTLPSGGVPANVEEIPTPAEKEPAPPQVKDYSANRATAPPSDSPMMKWAIDPRTPLRFSDSARFSLDYELEAVGTSGVDAVELWGSLDGGRTWKRWGADPDRQSPFDIETNGEGIFAYRIVVLSANGLASPRPLPGDIPDIAIIVDSTPPAVRITGAQYGEGDRIGSLLIQYSCSDDHLRTRPISLAFSETPDGPWTTIASGLSNEGLYAWPASPQLPRQLYLRIDATDEAGNTGSYILDTPIDAQGLAPRARIRGLQTLSNSIPVSSSEQTATRPSASFK